MSQCSELNRRGVVLKQQGRYDEAAACYQKAIRLEPQFAEAHFNLALLYRDLGQIDEALSALEMTDRLRPKLPVVQAELARLYIEKRRFQDAEAVLKGLVQVHPDDESSLALLGTCLQEQNRFAEAEPWFRKALERNPGHAAVLTNLGQTLKAQGRFEEAIACYEQAIAIDPQLAEAHSNLGNSWLAIGKFEAGLAEYSIAAALRPDSARSHVDLGNAWQRLERFPEAVAAYQKAIELDVNHTDAWLNAVHLLKEIGDTGQATQIVRQLRQRQPNEPAHWLRDAALCPLVFCHQAEMDEYRQRLFEVTGSLQGTEWNFDFSRWTVYAPECPYNLQFLDGNLLGLKKAYAGVFVDALAKWQRGISHRIAGRKRPRIGFVVTAKHERAFLKLFGGVLERLNGDRWELFVIGSRLGAEQLRAGIRRTDATVVSFPERFDSIVSTVAETECDLLYYWEVGNDPTNYFLPFLRLAPIQVTSWGIQVTSGIAELDAYLSSDLVEVPEADQHYTERLIRAATLLTYQFPVAVPAGAKTRSAFGFAADTHLYGCVQNLGKFHPEFDAALAAILRQDPKGIIVTARDANGFAARILQSRWQAVMPDVVDRIRFLPPLSQADYLALLANCDVLLDPLHFGGVTTTYDAIALRKPLVTLPTQFHRGRYTAACLRKAGVTDTIAKTFDDYIDLAVRVAADRDSQLRIAAALDDGSRKVFEDQLAVSEHERIFEELLADSR